MKKLIGVISALLSSVAVLLLWPTSAQPQVNQTPLPVKPTIPDPNFDGKKLAGDWTLITSVVPSISTCSIYIARVGRSVSDYSYNTFTWTFKYSDVELVNADGPPIMTPHIDIKSSSGKPPILKSGKIARDDSFVKTFSGKSLDGNGGPIYDSDTKTFKMIVSPTSGDNIMYDFTLVSATDVPLKFTGRAIASIDGCSNLYNVELTKN